MQSEKVWYRINCGADEDFVDGNERVWKADYKAGESEDLNAPETGPGGWVRIGGGGPVRESVLPLYPEELAGLLRTECFSLSAYRFQLPAGVYTIRLVLAETHETLGNLERNYTLSINDRTLSQPVRPATIAQGFARAGILSIEGVEVEDEGLELRFGKNANLYGLEILSCDPDAPFRIKTEAIAPQCLLPLDTEAPHRPRFLFVGNSGTFFWAIPETVQRLIHQQRPDILLDMEAFYRGGKDVEFFCKSADVDKLLKESTYDFVVLQDSSRGPLLNPEGFETYMSLLVDKVKASGATPILYAYSGPLEHSPEQRLEIQERYNRMAEKHDIPVLPCAAALRRAISEYPDENFHNPDRNHVGMLTGYLFACVWFRALTGQSAADIPDPITLGGYVSVPDDIAERMAEIADAICAEMPTSPILSAIT